jgi:serine/threonine protein kinase
MSAESVSPGERKTDGSAQREIRICPACGTKFSANGDGGFCPVCLLLRAAGTDSALSEALNPVPGSEHSSADQGPGSIVPRFEHYEVMLNPDGKPLELGRGAMGVTYKALDINLRCAVTLKVINERYLGDESARARFLREARAAAKVRHANVASVFHLGRSKGEYFYAMEFVEGETLEDLMKRSGRLEIKLALEIAAQVASGLAAVHKQRLVHRDIKPSNIMVSLEAGGAVIAKIIDLGLAKPAPEVQLSEAPISIPGAFAGTPEFASPEQFAGVGVDIRSDLYSLGVVLWKMLTGDVPFRGSTAEVMYQHQHGLLPLEALDGLSEPAIILLKTLLEKGPLQRIQSPVDLLKAIEETRAAIHLNLGRSVPQQEFWAISRQRRSAQFSGKEGALRTSSKIRPLRPAVISLVVGGVVILTVNAFLPERHPLVGSSVTPSDTMKVPEKSAAVQPFQSFSETKSSTRFADVLQGQITDQSALAFFERGLAKEKKGDLDGAMADYNQAIKLNPKYALAYNDRGETELTEGDLDRAMADFNQAIMVDPKLAYPYNYRGSVKVRKGDLDGAIADFTQAILLKPQYGLAYKNRGRAKRKKADFDGAIYDLNRAIELGVNLDD